METFLLVQNVGQGKRKAYDEKGFRVTITGVFSYPTPRPVNEQNLTLRSMHS